MEMKATEVDWLSEEDPTMAWHRFKHLPPFSSMRIPTAQEILPLDSPINKDALRIVAISDTHSWSLANLNLPKGDILIHAGDFSRTGSESQITEFNKQLGNIAPLYRAIVVISGNHDIEMQNTPSFRTLLTNCHYLEDADITLAGVKFYGSPWTPQFYNWAFMKRRGPEIDEVWRAIPHNTDVLITHGPPLGILDLTHDSSRSGCLSLANHVINRVKPKFHIYGHIHERRGVVSYGNTSFINASTCTVTYRPINPPIVFDISLPSGHSKEEINLQAIKP